MNSDEEKYLKELGSRKVYKIPYGVDTKKFRPIRRARQNKFVVTFLARLTWQKGIDVLIKAIERLSAYSQIRKEVLFRIVGYGNEEVTHKVVQLAETNKGFVEYLGAVSHEQVPNLLASSDLFVLPSRYETFGIPILEAQSCGVPVIATKIQGPKDIVIHEKTGLLIRPNSTVELVKGILRFYKLWKFKPDEYEKFRYYASKNALRYDWDSIAQRVKVMLREILNKDNLQDD
jgi:glycosyltransferase involved in cell wall biosynthesis